MSDGGRAPHAPGVTPPRDLAGFARELAAAPRAIGRWAEPLDVGAVRLIATIPGRTPNRRLLLFGAHAAFGRPLLLAVADHGMIEIIPVGCWDTSRPGAFPTIQTCGSKSFGRLASRPPCDLAGREQEGRAARPNRG